MSASLRLAVAQADPAQLREAFVRVAASGGLLVFPTDTVYGLGARADSEPALRRLMAAKCRAPDHPLPVLVGAEQQLVQVAACLPPEARHLAQAFWPGAVTVVVNRAPALSPLVTGGRDTVGVRMPDYAALRDWLCACPFPLAVTSANLSGEPAAADLAEVSALLLEAVDLIVEGETCPGGTPSTVVDVTCRPPQVLRLGPITPEQIASVLSGQRDSGPREGS